MAVIKFETTQGTVAELPIIVALDTSLSTASTNGVQNKVITTAINAIDAKIGEINTALDNINGEVI